KNVIAVTIDNPTVMKAYHSLMYPLQTFACFLHSLNTLIGEIFAYPLMKKTVTQTTCIVMFFTSSHYWSGQPNDEVKQQGTSQWLKQSCK
ncbi:hypothetical protein PAXRUDRAFT_164513, partial [Paxillus rubicundulus Ve08.2h10]